MQQGAGPGLRISGTRRAGLRRMDPAGLKLLTASITGCGRPTGAMTLSQAGLCRLRPTLRG